MMKYIVLFVAVFLFGMGCGVYSVKPADKGFASPAGATSVYFSPKGGCTQACVDAIGEAKQSILVQAYSFTSDPIENALIAAAKRGAKVVIIIDKSMYSMKGAGTDKLLENGIEVYIDGKHPIAHNKVMVIDGSILITGSFNFTKQAESNAENMLVIRDRAMAEFYVDNWGKHLQHSERYKP